MNGIPGAAAPTRSPMRGWESLLQDVCVQLEFCLESDDKRALLELLPATVDTFTEEVIRREGLHPLTLDSAIRELTPASPGTSGTDPWPRTSCSRHGRLDHAPMDLREGAT